VRGTSTRPLPAPHPTSICSERPQSSQLCPRNCVKVFRHHPWRIVQLLILLSCFPIALFGAQTQGLAALNCSSGSETGSAKDACTVTIFNPAPGGGLNVILTSSNAAVTLPASVTVPIGATSTGFTATVSAVAITQSVTLKATMGRTSASNVLQLNAAVPTLSINATNVGFGNLVVNTSATQSLTLTSTGSAPVTIGGATLSGTGFTISTETWPVTLNPGAQLTLNVQFEPTVAGAGNGQLTITSNSSTGSSVVIGLNGAGEAHTVELSWDAPSSSSDPIVAYNVYRATGGSTAFQLLNSVSSSETTLLDSSVQSGQTYEYIVESVDGSGDVSGPSNLISVTIPSGAGASS
jgi:hypothetical protein